MDNLFKKNKIKDKNQFIKSIFETLNNSMLLEQKRLELETIYNQLNNSSIIDYHLKVFLK